ncbi:hypothetical protein [Marinimicrobium sp. LS-A18]|uniref:hypothetical protein n=1 Tax=Marinimicrobium sp. LS-A18 TaxID=1381596 RepID=UPI000465197A|nr:hypothetical protein [Marinimicrobium sp. LS-A18]
MKEPYGSILSSYTEKFHQLGISLLRDEKHRSIFSLGNTFVEISVERYYMPSITSKVIDQNGNKYSVLVLRKLLEPECLTADIDRLEEFKGAYGVSGGSEDIELNSEEVLMYLGMQVKQLLGFLSRNLSVLKAEGYSELPFKEDYLKRENEMLGRLGL